jgi:hypothetical protein
MSYWSKLGHFSSALSKGPVTTTWIWNLHAEAHDFDSHAGPLHWSRRKAFSSALAHIAVVFFWLAGMSFHGAYFSNFAGWMADPQHVKPSAHIVWDIVGQSILNADTGAYFQGLPITSAFFELWRSQGLVAASQLKSSATIGLLSSAVSLSSVHTSTSTVRSQLARSSADPARCSLTMFAHYLVSHPSLGPVTLFTYHFQSTGYSTQALIQQSSLGLKTCSS